MGFGRENIREVIAEKARDFLLMKNPEEITMLMVADQLNITAVTLYQYFEGKEEIIRAGYDLILKEIAECIDIKLPSSVNCYCKLKIVLKNLADYFYRKGVDPTWLIEDPPRLPITLKPIRNTIAGLLKSWHNCDDDKAIWESCRYLSLVQAEIIYYKRSGKPLPDNIIENIFKLLHKNYK